MRHGITALPMPGERILPFERVTMLAEVAGESSLMLWLLNGGADPKKIDAGAPQGKQPTAASPGEGGPPSVTRAWRSIGRDLRAGLRWAILGGVTGVVATPALVALTTLVFRFPVPFSDYVSGPGGVIPATVAGVLFYGVFFGGLAVQASLGAAAGFAGARLGEPHERRMRSLCILSAVLAAECGVLVLAVLDFIIGPW